MKFKNIVIYLAFLAFVGSVWAQHVVTDARIDGFHGSIKSSDQTMYAAVVKGEQMQRGDLLEHLRAEYNKNGYRRSMEFLGNHDSVLFRSRYKHDGFGLTTLEHIVAPDESVIGRTYYLYDANNILKEWYVEDAERQVENRVLISYDGQGRVDKRSYNDQFNNIYKRELYTYGAGDNVEKTVVLDSKGNKVQELRYEYDNNNMPVSQTVYDYSENPGEPEVTFTVWKYQYDSHGNWIQKVEYEMDNFNMEPLYITERHLEYYE